MGIKFGTNVSNRMLLNAAKFQGYNFYFSWIIKGKPTGGGGKITPPPHKLGLKSVINNGTEVTLNLSSNLIGNSNDETNFPHKLLSTDTQVSKICEAFANGSSTNV